jgi:hypothetical protein
MKSSLDILSLLERIFGPYPFGDFSIVEFPDEESERMVPSVNSAAWLNRLPERTVRRL